MLLFAPSAFAQWEWGIGDVGVIDIGSDWCIYFPPGSPYIPPESSGPAVPSAPSSTSFTDLSNPANAGDTDGSIVSEEVGE